MAVDSKLLSTLCKLKPYCLSNLAHQGGTEPVAWMEAASKS